MHFTIFLALDSIFGVQINFFPLSWFYSAGFFLFSKFVVVESCDTEWKKSWILGLRTKRIIIIRFIFWVVCDEIKPWFQPKRHNNARIKMYKNAFAKLVSVNLNIKHCCRPLTIYFSPVNWFQKKFPYTTPFQHIAKWLA